MPFDAAAAAVCRQRRSISPLPGAPARPAAAAYQRVVYALGPANHGAHATIGQQVVDRATNTVGVCSSAAILRRCGATQRRCVRRSEGGPS